MSPWSIGIDIGGTFTDVVALDHADGRQHSVKVLTTHADPTRGIVAAVEDLIRSTGLQAARVTRVVHATTLFTNALIERRGAATALLTNRGFEDVLEVGNERKYDLYDLSIERAPPLVPANWRKGIAGRLDARGEEIEPIDPNEVVSVVDSLLDQGIESLAVGLLHAWASDRHERELARRINRVFPHLPITLSCDIAPVIREYERLSTTVASAYIKPLAARYLDTLEARLQALGLRGKVLMMLSNGGLTHLSEARARPIELLESGPAAGAIAAAELGARDGLGPLLAFDMGGTTAKLSLVESGQPFIAYGFEAARRKRFAEGSGLPIRITTVDLIEIGAGGGSVAHLDPMRLMKVGPESAGSDPGPACYALGGEAPTVTDANLLLGYLNPDYFAAGSLSLDRSRAHDAIAVLGQALGLSPVEAAWGIHDIVAENMASAARVHIAERGRNPADHVLVCTGGGGPLHGYRVAQKIGVRRLVCPPDAGVASAMGLLVAPARIDRARTVSLRPETDPLDKLESSFAELAADALAALADVQHDFGPVRLHRQADGRFVGQAFHLTVDLPDGPYDGRVAAPGEQGLNPAHDASPFDEAAMRARLHEAFVSGYQRKFGRTPPSVAVELVTLRVSARAPAPPVGPSSQASGHRSPPVSSAPSGRVSRLAAPDSRPVYFPELGGFVDTPVLRRADLPDGFQSPGPLLIEDAGSTLVLGPQAHVMLSASGNLIIDLEGSRP